MQPSRNNLRTWMSGKYQYTVQHTDDSECNNRKVFLVSFQFWWLSSHSVLLSDNPTTISSWLIPIHLPIFYLFLKLLGRFGPEKVPRKRKRPRIFRRKMRKPRRMPRRLHKKRHGPHNKPRRNKPCQNNNNTDSSTVGCSSIVWIQSIVSYDHCVARTNTSAVAGRQVTITRGY